MIGKSLEGNPWGMIMSALIRLLVVVLLFPLCACESRSLIDGMDEKQSIDILIALDRLGISAQREPMGSGSSRKYEILVRESDYSSALKLIGSFDIVKDGSKGKLKQDAILPLSRDLAKLQWDAALASQVERQLESIPGVISASVMLRTSSNSSGVEPQKTASIVLRVDGDPSLTIEREKVIKLLLANVAGLRPENVELQIFPIFASALQGNKVRADLQAPSLVQLKYFGFSVAASDVKVVLVQIVTLLVGVAVSAFIVGLIVGNYFVTSKERWEISRRRLLRREESPLATKGSSLVMNPPLVPSRKRRSQE